MTCPECGCTIMYCESSFVVGDCLVRRRCCAECGTVVFTAEKLMDSEDGKHLEEQYGMSN